MSESIPETPGAAPPTQIPPPTRTGASASSVEPAWQRRLVPILALVAALAALVAYGALRLLAPATQPYAGGPIALRPAEAPDSPFKGFAIQPERPAPPLSLTDQHGAAWQLADQRGRVTALFFGYTHCPDVCPQTMQRLGEALRQLGPDAAKVTMAMVTIDPERDTPEVMGRYVEAFHPAFVGLYGTPSQVQRAAQDYGVQYARELPPDQATAAAALAGHDEAAHGDAASGTAHDGASHEEAADHDAAGVMTPGTEAYTVAHSGVVFLIDPQGQMRSSFLGSFDPAEVVNDVRVLLSETG